MRHSGQVWSRGDGGAEKAHGSFPDMGGRRAPRLAIFPQLWDFKIGLHMALMTSGQYGAHVGVSRQTVEGWKRDTKWIVLVGKKIDSDATDANLKKYRAAGVKPSKARAVKPDTQADTRADSLGVGREMKPGPDTPAAAAERILAASGATWDMEEAKRVKENYLALLNQLAYEEKSGSLVPLDVAESVLFTKAREFRDAVLNWPAKAAPLIAADLGIEADKVTEILTAHVHTFIAGLSEPRGDFKV